MNDANRGTPVLPAASEQSGNYPRPQLVRSSWASLDGEWDFAFDDDDQGLEGAWYLPGDKSDAAFSSTIRVPFPPESSASTIGDNGFHSVCWYRRAVSARPEGDASARIVLHFGAVDYRAHVWFDGTFLGSHEGGSTPFSFDITRALAGAGGTGTLVVRAEDDPRDVEQPRGKQDWREEPHGIWYHRTTGIWQPVWLEQVPALHVTNLSWIPGSTLNTVRLDLGLNVRPSAPVQVHIALTLRGEELASVHFTQSEPRSSTVITIPRQANGQEYEALLWSPENPRLIDAEVSVRAISGDTDTVASYFGLRTAGWADGHFLLNDRPVYVRAVLAQGYWPNSHLAAPSPSALRDEIQLIKDLGFNTARVHQKIEDPRFLYWADRLGIMLWGENGSAYEFSPTAINRMSREWLDALERDLSHPSIVTWVPLNESWGVQHISHSPEQLDYARALYHLTKAIDPTRPTISNDGWEHADSDIWTIHDYGTTGAELAVNYTDRGTVSRLMSGLGPLGRRMKLVSSPDRGQPVIVSEFGGVSFTTTPDAQSWGYSTVRDADDFEARLRDLFAALQTSPVLAGFCYTQLTDTLQEANGLADVWRKPKLPAATIAAIVRGELTEAPVHRRPRTPIEQHNAPADQQLAANLPLPTKA